MVLGLVLHASHHEQPENIIFPVVARGQNLVVNEAHIWLLSVPLLSLVVANQYVGRVESREKLSDEPVEKIMMPECEAGVVEKDHEDIKLNHTICTYFFFWMTETKESNLHFKYKNS